VMRANFAVGELVEAAAGLREKALVTETLEIDARNPDAFEVPRTRDPPVSGDGERAFSMVLSVDHRLCCYPQESVAKHRAFATQFTKSVITTKRSFENVAEWLFPRLGSQGPSGMGLKAGFFGDLGRESRIQKPTADGQPPNSEGFPGCSGRASRKILATAQSNYVIA
jgi:hypothetical protein